MSALDEAARLRDRWTRAFLAVTVGGPDAAGWEAPAPPSAAIVWLQASYMFLVYASAMLGGLLVTLGTLVGAEGWAGTLAGLLLGLSVSAIGLCSPRLLFAWRRPPLRDASAALVCALPTLWPCFVAGAALEHLAQPQGRVMLLQPYQAAGGTLALLSLALALGLRFTSPARPQHERPS